MDLEKRFMESASIIKNRDTDISNDDLLHLYGLYKQGTIGNCDLGNQPWTMFKEERARWNAWYKNYNMIKYLLFLIVVLFYNFLYRTLYVVVI